MDGNLDNNCAGNQADLDRIHEPMRCRAWQKIGSKIAVTRLIIV